MDTVHQGGKQITWNPQSPVTAGAGGALQVTHSQIRTQEAQHGLIIELEKLISGLAKEKVIPVKAFRVGIHLWSCEKTLRISHRAKITGCRIQERWRKC